MPLKSAFVLIPALIFSTQALAFGSHDTWSSGYAQGTAEYIILGKRQAQLYLACESSGSQPASIIFTDANGHQVSMDSGQRLTMKIDSEDVADVSESESHVGSSNVMWAWNKLRTGKKVVVFGSGVKPATFTLKGATDVIPEFGDNGCVPKFALP